jgi:hypothetical protein
MPKCTTGNVDGGFVHLLEVNGIEVEKGVYKSMANDSKVGYSLQASEFEANGTAEINNASLKAESKASENAGLLYRKTTYYRDPLSLFGDDFVQPVMDAQMSVKQQIIQGNLTREEGRALYNQEVLPVLKDAESKIPELFGRIREREPRASITICSSMATYGTPEADGPYRELFDRLSNMEGVTLRGSLNQSDLYQEYAKASIFFYPCTWPETYCIALDEALAHDCKPIVSKLGALSERAHAVPNLALAALEAMAAGYKRETLFQPQDWMEVAKRWEAEVLK